MKLEKLLAKLQTLAPLNLAESWDKVGLHLGDPKWDIKHIIFCIDLNSKVLQYAIKSNAQLIIAYHPPIFTPLAALNIETAKQKLILDAATHRIALYSPHTALDAAVGGVNDWLASGLGKAISTSPITLINTQQTQYKIVTFVPTKNFIAVRQAMFNAGAGGIGNYQQCSFSHTGEGTFFASQSAHPAVGQKGRLEHIAETRLEMLCPQSASTNVIAALRKTHPYEQPAFDLFRLEQNPCEANPPQGQGRIIRLEKPIRFELLVRRIKKHLGLKYLKVAKPQNNKLIEHIGLCAGAGASLLPHAHGIDVFFTGEMRHHDVLEALAQNVSIILAGHTNTERPYLPIYAQKVQQCLDKQIRCTVSKQDQSPLEIV